jgi:hypothetical protein
MEEKTTLLFVITLMFLFTLSNNVNNNIITFADAEVPEDIYIDYLPDLSINIMFTYGVPPDIYNPTLNKTYVINWWVTVTIGRASDNVSQNVTIEIYDNGKLILFEVMFYLLAVPLTPWNQNIQINQLHIKSFNWNATEGIHLIEAIVDPHNDISEKNENNNRDFFIIEIKMQPTIAGIDLDPNTLNLKSKGRWITCYITLNEPYDPSDIDISTILLEDTIPAEWGDIQGDTLMVKFDRSEVEDMLSPRTYILKVTGELTDGTSFEGYSDEIRVIDPGN